MEKNHAKGHEMNTKKHPEERNEANMKANNFIDSGQPLLRGNPKSFLQSYPNSFLFTTD